MKQLNTFITEYIIKKKLEKPIDSENKINKLKNEIKNKKEINNKKIKNNKKRKWRNQNNNLY